MNKNLFVAALFAVSATGTLAQSKFEGAYGQAGIGYESISPSLSYSLRVGGVGIPTAISAGNSNSFTGTATLGYTFAVTKDFLLGIGGEYTPIASNSENINLSVVGQNILAGTYKKKNSYNFFISPGMALGNDSVAYAKVGYAGSKIAADPDSTNFKGYSLGLGYKKNISGSLYGFGEINYVSYGNKTTASQGTILNLPASSTTTSKANTTNILIGIGYRF